MLEKETRLAQHQTGHNSGVVHAGLYYKPGSLKATLCAAGRVSIREFCEEKGLPYREVGKLVVAVDESELAALAEIERRVDRERRARPGAHRRRRAAARDRAARRRRRGGALAAHRGGRLRDDHRGHGAGRACRGRRRSGSATR